MPAMFVLHARLHRDKLLLSVKLTFAICDGLELSNFVFGMWDENWSRVERFLVTDLAKRANLLRPAITMIVIN